MWTATSSTRSPARFSRSSASTSGAPLAYGCAITGIAFAVDRGHPARRVVERAAEPDVHRLLQQADPEAPRARRRVAVGVVALARGEARADGDVARVRRARARAGAGARRRDAGRRRRPGRSTRTRARTPRGSPRRSRPAGRGSRRTRRRSRRARARDRGGGVRRPVVDHEHVGIRQPGAQLGEDGREAQLLVPGGDEDDGVAVGHGGSLLGEPTMREQCGRP